MWSYGDRGHRWSMEPGGILWVFMDCQEESLTQAGCRYQVVRSSSLGFLRLLLENFIISGLHIWDPVEPDHVPGFSSPFMYATDSSEFLLHLPLPWARLFTLLCGHHLDPYPTQLHWLLACGGFLEIECLCSPIPSPKFICQNLNSQGDDVRRWGLWEFLRSWRWSPHEWL